MQLSNFDLGMKAGRQRYPIMFRFSGYSRKSYFALTTVLGLASLILSPEGSLSYIYPNNICRTEIPLGTMSGTVVRVKFDLWE
jgi:hypothetical protein